MGIQGLLPMLKEIQESGHIEHFRGKRLAVDAYVWLHKGAFGCAEALVKGQVNTKFVDYAMHRVRLLRHYGIEPYIVFDGGPLPAKKVTEVARAKSRAESLAKARSLESQGRGHQARDHYTKCLDITPELAFQLIKALRAEEVDYIVAPYEADAQLCYLEREGIVDGIITEDSDLLVFGCKQVIFKLDGQGHCVWINRERFGETSSFPMHGWTDVEFRRMTMLSGCDYLPSIQGMGLKTAHRMLRRCKTVEKTLATVRMEGSMDIPSTYLAQFAQAELAFMYQRVYCPRAQRIITLNELPEVGISEDDHKWIGLDFDVEIGRAIAKGDIHPETRESIQDPWPQYRPVALKSFVKKAVLRENSRGNVVAGPMDAFVNRQKIRKPLLVKPVGSCGADISSLSTRGSFDATSVAGPSKSRSAGNKDISVDADRSSKYFGRKPTEKQRLEANIQTTAAELEWEKSDEEGPDVEFSQTPQKDFKHETGVMIERHHSPPLDSPRDPQHVTPPRSNEARGPPFLEPPNVSMTSSPSRMPELTSPALSSPVDRPNYDDDDHVFSPERFASRSGASNSPLSGRHMEQEVVSETQYSVPVLIPASSPTVKSLISSRPLPRSFQDAPAASARIAPLGSSDSIEEEEVRTPEAGSSHKRRIVKDEHIDTVDPSEQETAKRAEMIGIGWKAKFAFTASPNFPAPRSTRITKMAKTIPPRLDSPSAALSSLGTSPSVLRSKSANLDVTTAKSPSIDRASPKRARVIRPVSSVKEVENVPLDEDMGEETPGKFRVSSQAASILEKFRYSGVRL